MSAQELFYTVKEFAAILRVHPNTIRRAIKEEKINAFRVGQGEKSSWRIYRTELNRIGIDDNKRMVTQIAKQQMKELKGEIK